MSVRLYSCTVVKCNGRPLYDWVDAETGQPVWFGVSLRCTTQNSDSFEGSKQGMSETL